MPERKPKGSQGKRKPPTARQRLQVLQRDNYTCTSCGRSPVTTQGLSLHVDHVEPRSKGGADALENYQTLCDRCNLGKGNQSSFNKTLKAEIDVLLDDINPELRPLLDEHRAVGVVANLPDFVRLEKANAAHDPPLYTLIRSDSTASGRGAGQGGRLPPVNDSGGEKALFTIAEPEFAKLHGWS
jgi:hypothetical protein